MSEIRYARPRRNAVPIREDLTAYCNKCEQWKHYSHFTQQGSSAADYYYAYYIDDDGSGMWIYKPRRECKECAARRLWEKKYPHRPYISDAEIERMKANTPISTVDT